MSVVLGEYGYLRSRMGESAGKVKGEKAALINTCRGCTSLESPTYDARDSSVREVLSTSFLGQPML